MSPSKQRIAIAEVCGYKWGNLRKEKDFIGWNLAGQYIPRLPDYLNSLDAMREAEATLGATLRAAMASVLYDICGCWADTINATASQRAEAFLKVTGKWDAEA